MPSSVPSALHTLSRQVLVPAAGEPEEAHSGKCPYPSWPLSMVAGCLVGQRDQ